MTPKIKDKFYYFTESAVPAAAKCIWYAFTIPSSIRKAIEKSSEYKKHIEVLEETIDKTRQDISLKKYIQIGDLTGYLGGLASLAIYAKETTEHPNMLLVWLGLNIASLGYETSRAIHKRQRRK